VSTSVLVAYATTYGSTKEVAEAVAAALREGGLKVDVQPAREVKSLKGYGAVVLGAPLYMFHWHKDALNFLARQRAAFTEQPAEGGLRVAIFALGPFHNDDKEKQAALEQLNKELAKFPWLKPAAVEIFAGKLDPARLHFPFNLFMRQMPASDERDWSAIRAWASSIIEKLYLKSTCKLLKC
jgi:menaquinone-dependent protoporphyrinogen oxidase